MASTGGPQARGEAGQPPGARSAPGAFWDRRRSGLRGAVLAAVLACTAMGQGAEPGEQERRSTAVALNYCRASFHRILRCPSKRVLIEEQEKILNNLNLNEIADEEVVRLYTAVLAEITDVRIADREKLVLRDGHARVFRRQIVLNAFAVGAQAATAQYGAVVRTGVQSWWDYRNMVWHRELDQWKLDKERIHAVADKSALFLDTFWKLARRRSIPDDWLVRNDDLDRLEAALEEARPEVRLRVLQRMERFMECYPPYWYYVARTHQALGQFPAAAATWEKLAALGAGHFRKDDMLAAALANLALIQDYLGQPQAAPSALAALRQSTMVWEVNLVCAAVLERHGHFDEAEDAILRNLDVELEREQSLLGLLGLYCRTGNRQCLAARLHDPETLAALSVPALLECAAFLGTDPLPKPLLDHLAATQHIEFDLHFGPDDLVMYATSEWQLPHARITLSLGEQKFTQPAVTSARGAHEARFRRIVELGSPLKPLPNALPVSLALKYPDQREIRLHLRPAASAPVQAAAVSLLEAGALPAGLAHRGQALRIAAVEVGDVPLCVAPGTGRPNKAPEVRTSDGIPPKREENGAPAAASPPPPPELSNPVAAPPVIPPGLSEPEFIPPPPDDDSPE